LQQVPQQRYPFFSVMILAVGYLTTYRFIMVLHS